ncbi:hypothetical protein DL769_003962 [Monosporascus sp. CRB-8-3]|nr:hypothetical protein DL769_003962 [Monosporascus sp. CRB-8-3]
MKEHKYQLFELASSRIRVVVLLPDPWEGLSTYPSLRPLYRQPLVSYGLNDRLWIRFAAHSLAAGTRSRLWGNESYSTLHFRLIPCGEHPVPSFPREYYVGPRSSHQESPRAQYETLSERSAQVVRTSEIYRSATRVIIWPAAAVDRRGLAMSTSHFFGTQVEYTQNGHYLPASGCSMLRWSLPDMNLGYDGDTLDSLYHLANRPWFTRLWVLQEAQLANNGSIVKCGEDEVLWPVFRCVMLCAQKETSGIPRHLRSLLAGHA